MKEKVNQMLKEKLFLVMLVLGLLAMVAAAGILTLQREKGNQTNPYLEMPQEELLAKESLPENQQTAGPSEAKAQLQKEKETKAAGTEAKNPNAGSDLAAEAGIGQEGAKALVLDFKAEDRLAWPVTGNVILDYSMDKTTYFPTLDQDKCNPGIVIQSEISAPVAAPANARVLEVGSNEEIGSFVVLDLGNGYTATCGQLKEVAAAAGDYLEQGQVLGYVSEPTKYYSVEGVNVFFKLQDQGQMVDPLDFME